MSTTELVIDSIILSSIWGGIIGWAGCYYLHVDPLRRQRDTERARNVKMNLRIAGAARRHLGTPYIRTQVPHVVRTGEPGLRLIEGHRVYSADFLNDDAQVNP